MTLERMTLYLEKHPNVIKDIATNCAVVDEELNEFSQRQGDQNYLCCSVMRGNSDSLWYLTDQPVVQPPDPERNHPTQQEESGLTEGLEGHSAHTRRVSAQTQGPRLGVGGAATGLPLAQVE